MTDDKVEVMAWAGDLDARAADRLAELLGTSRASGVRDVVLDLGQVGFVSSAGFGALVAETGAFREAGGDLWLCGFTPQVRAVADLLGLSRVARVHEDRAAALDALGAARMAG
ncbi:MAG: STAS domain-containing protein [Candidatus Sericytochromatia bacterium]|nr:STAS domain-containing protein [Candidatus Sericytochromatia bacterium]